MLLLFENYDAFVFQISGFQWNMEVDWNLFVHIHLNFSFHEYHGKPRYIQVTQALELETDKNLLLV